uniref:Uncharacterized protein n=1 Tax=Ditylenchus dipsaci TaxID=166011 RepID=A0A915DTD1_9BILA
MKNQTRNDLRQVNTLDSTLDQVLVEMAAENRNSRDQRRSSRRNVMIRQTLNQVNTGSSVGVDPLKLWANAKDGCEEYCNLGFGGFSIPATSAPIEESFLKQGWLL